LMMDEVKPESIFAKPGPVKKGTLKQVDLSPRERDDFFGMVFTGYIKAGAGIHRFDEHEYIENRLNPNYYKSLSLISVGDARMWIDSKAIDMGELKGKFVPGVTNLVSHGKMYLGEGVHPFTLIYFNEGANTFLKFTPPETWVPETEILAGCVKAAALVMTGEGGMAQEVLLALRPDAWPLGEEKQIQLTSDLRKIPKWVREDWTDAALKVIDSWLVKHPMLQTVPVFMLAKMETVVAVGDDTRACTLGEQIGRMDLNQTQREQWMLMQVKAALKAGKMDAARDVYVKLKETAPYSQATIEAREAITKTVRGK